MRPFRLGKSGDEEQRQPAAVTRCWAAAPTLGGHRAVADPTPTRQLTEANCLLTELTEGHSSDCGCEMCEARGGPTCRTRRGAGPFPESRRPSRHSYPRLPQAPRSFVREALFWTAGRVNV
jgi:hypothetical protein